MTKKTIIETSKTIAISALIGAIVAFAIGFTVGGSFQKQQTQELMHQVQSLSAATTEPSK